VTKLTSAQRSYLKSLAHHLDPICFIGKNGLTDAVLQSVVIAFDANELLKLKFNDCKKEKQELCDRIVEELDCCVVGVVGHVAILYREHPDPEKRVISLP
jgi:RNA-binding protein